MTRPRSVERHPFGVSRRLVLGVVRNSRQTYPMHGLVDVDVTTAWERCHAAQPHLSFTAFLIACLGRAIAAHPEVHAYRDWRGRLVVHRHVDVGTMVEVGARAGPAAIGYAIRDADIRTVADVSTELLGAKRYPSDTPASRWMGPARVLTRVPGLTRLMFSLLRRSVRMRSMAGTALVTSVGMFGGGGGFGIAPLSMASVALVVGGVSPRPRVVEGRVEARQVLDLTVSIDHSVVDGAPAARFFAELRRLIESAELLAE